MVGQSRPEERRIQVRRKAIDRGFLSGWLMTVVLLVLASGLLYLGLMAWLAWKR